MKIAMMGLECRSANKGCEALTYSFINLAQKVAEKNLELHVFGYADLGNIQQKYPNIPFHHHRISVKNPFKCSDLRKEFDQMDLIVDATYGDGFSDIYGKKWNAITNLAKRIAIRSKTPFLLLPQTYGPFYNRFLRKWAYHIIKGADVAFSRDALSAKEVNGVIGDKVIETTDLAFALPFDKNAHKFDRTKIHIGLNISSLLWDGGHANTIHLATNYREYCKKILETLIARENVVVHLIPHVIDNENYDCPENDVRVCDAVHALYPNTILAPSFADPIEAKNYICQMDVFIGARMHATIGSFSSGVTTIPFSYSKKFEGLFGNLNYPYVISATKVSTKEAVAQTLSYIENPAPLKEAQAKGMTQIEGKLQLILNTLAKYARQKG